MRVVGILVRMKLHRELAIGAFDLLIGGVSSDAQNFVVIAFFSCHVANKPCVTYEFGKRSKQRASLLCWPARNNHFRRPKQSVFKSITAANLAQHSALGKLVARLMSNRFVQVWIECFAFRLYRLQPVFREQIVKLFLDENHSGINRGLVALLSCGSQTKLEVIDNCYQLLE